MTWKFPTLGKDLSLCAPLDFATRIRALHQGTKKKKNFSVRITLKGRYTVRVKGKKKGIFEFRHENKTASLEIFPVPEQKRVYGVTERALLDCAQVLGLNKTVLESYFAKKNIFSVTGGSVE